MKSITKLNGQLARRLYSNSSGFTIPAKKQQYVPKTGTYPKGFKVSGTVVGVKPSNTTKPDLAFITSDRPCAAAAVFTKNKFQAAPVTFSRALLQEKNNNGLQGVIINSGCANAVTGKGGLEDAEAMAKEADKTIGADKATIVMSTGVIGQRWV
jgi:glutamate N-acetyltransferase / amino-acid N-acetyltransferase